QARDTYGDVAGLLGESGLAARDVLGETVFLRDVRDAAPFLEERARVLGEDAPLPSLVGQAPLDGSALQVVATAIAPAAPGAPRDAVDLRVERPCTCAACTLAGARLVRLGGRSILRTSGLQGIGASLFEQAIDAFRAGDRLLRESGLGFHDVVRTWVWLRDIDRDYAELNAARRAFFAECGLARPPASTGVQGIPQGEGHDVSIVVEATSRAGASAPESMTTPLLNEAPSYGADFSRGLRVADEQGTTLFVSGTASIDEAGRSVHPGDLAAQAGRMLDNVESLLAERGARTFDLVSGVVYAKRPQDGPALREICHGRGFRGFPCVFVEAPLCRPELLCEAEFVARLSLPVAGA
ncbi:MAG: hypothetical protein ACKOCT_11590, partial [Alphaproteobacteria bacterium]